jgi:acetolactate synthase-1/2/3 large subunit
MFPGLTSVDVTDLDGFAVAMRAALDIDGPAVVSIECAADEIPPFAPFLSALPANATATEEISSVKEDRADVVASA